MLSATRVVTTIVFGFMDSLAEARSPRPEACQSLQESPLGGRAHWSERRRTLHKFAPRADDGDVVVPQWLTAGLGHAPPPARLVLWKAVENTRLRAGYDQTRTFNDMNQPGPVRGHILAVDDQQPNLTLITQMLEAEGHVVRTAGTGLSALEAIDRQPPDLILLDVGLPDINGFEVCRRLKQNPLTRLTP